jgi:nucleotide-binding universal stress UspA family protein
VPLDGSELSQSILPYVEDVAEALGARIHLVNVVILPADYSAMGMAGYPAVNLDEWVAQARAYLATVQKQIEARGLEASSEVRIGFAVNEIVGAAYKAGAGLIAIATHGHSGVGRWVLGSTADGVLRRSELPCLIVRPQ